ncbi:hypothetical protein PR048_003834 [Dryococelus australis]|uniref:Uncharacterized protein n=1 Tax=Dryococelus australis TaxID=614101 RepID=A0ABQ9IP89_9NEOP|nr:hypothetical protein PR048_003834 [Dryococelus australis]
MDAYSVMVSTKNGSEGHVLRRHGNKAIKWYCGQCDNDEVMRNTSKGDANTTSEGNELKFILQKLIKLDILTAEQGKLRECVEFYAENFDDMTNEINEVRQKLDQVIAENEMMRKKLDTLHEESTVQKVEIADLKRENESLKQNLRCNNLELHGIPVKENENTASSYPKKSRTTTSNYCVVHQSTKKGRSHEGKRKFPAIYDCQSQSEQYKWTKQTSLRRRGVNFIWVNNGNIFTKINETERSLKIKEEDVINQLKGMLFMNGNNTNSTPNSDVPCVEERSFSNLLGYCAFAKSSACDDSKLKIMYKNARRLRNKMDEVKRATWTGVLKNLIEEEHSLLHVQLDRHCPVSLKKFENLLMYVQSRYTTVIGGFNIDSLSKSKEMQDYSDIITMYGFYQVNTIFSTRFSRTTNSLIDHVLVNKTQIKINYSNINIDLEGKLFFDTLENEENSDRMYKELIRQIKAGITANITYCNTKNRKRDHINPIRETWVSQELIQIIHSRDTL